MYISTSYQKFWMRVIRLYIGFSADFFEVGHQDMVKYKHINTCKNRAIMNRSVVFFD